jgi:hypothetical protein
MLIAIAMISVAAPTRPSSQPTVAYERGPDKPDGKLAKDHPIYSVPRLTLPEKKRPDVDLNSPYRGKLPVWAFTLDKTRFLLGEAITGKITIENMNKEESIHFSPPYRGFLVATVGIWVARRDEKTGWGKVEPLFQINRGWPSSTAELQGEPVNLAPGAKWQASFPVNGLMFLAEAAAKPDSVVPRWFSGVGFTVPGKYRVYLQYVNLERSIPFERRWTSFLEDPPAQKPLKQIPGSVALDLGPFVLGPYEVEVVALDGAETDELTERFQEWTKLFQREGKRFNVVPHGLPDLLKLKALQSEPLLSVRDSLSLTQFQTEMLSLPKGADERTRILADLVVKVRDNRRKVPRGPLYDAFGMTEGYLRYYLGKTDDALGLARELNTPDAKVFISDYATKQPNTRGSDK